jgi:hypothetical protein
MTLQSMNDPVSWVRAHPERYFRSGAPNALELAYGLWSTASVWGARDVLIHSHEETWVVAATANWLVEEQLSGAELFSRIVPQRAAGPNSMRSEVIVNAYCSEVVALVAGELVYFKGSLAPKDEVDRVLRAWSGLQAAIGFRL